MLKIIKGDITKIQCDAIVNAAKTSLLGGGGVDGAIHKAAGAKLLWECMKLGGCKVGQAKITNGYKLPAKYVIHAVGPKWKDGQHGEQELLESAYRESLKLAVENRCESVAFPLISGGIYGYPKEQALEVAIDTIASFLVEHDILVYIVIFDETTFCFGDELFSGIASRVSAKHGNGRFAFSVASYDNSIEGEALAEMRISAQDSNGSIHPT